MLLVLTNLFYQSNIKYNFCKYHVQAAILTAAKCITEKKYNDTNTVNNYEMQNTGTVTDMAKWNHNSRAG